MTDIAIAGDEVASGISFETAKGQCASLATEHVFLHQGVVPNVNLSMSIGLAHSWNEAQLCWHPDVDQWGAASIDGLFVAGDGAGIGGAVSAAAAGELVALQVLTRLGCIATYQRDSMARHPRRTLRREARIRPFLDAWFRPADHLRIPSEPSTMVCRCEEIRLGDLSDTLKLGMAGPNQLKSYTRAGMGAMSRSVLWLDRSGADRQGKWPSAWRCRLLSVAPADQAGSPRGDRRPTI